MEQSNNINIFSRIVTIEANIGAGKTTLLRDLKKKYKNNANFIFLEEPVEMWESFTDENGKTMIELFYSDQKEYSFPFQMMAFISRYAMLKEATEKNPNATIITERSLYTDRMVFAKMLFDSGFIKHINYKIYLKWFDTFASQLPISKVIYINSNPEICHARIMKRSRNGESVIPLSYLDSCNEYHTKMMESFNDEKIDKLIIDGNIDIYTNTEILNDWIVSIDEFIK